MASGCAVQSVFRLLMAFAWCAASLMAQNTVDSTKATEDSGFEIIEHRLKLQLFPSINGISCVDTLTIRRTARHAETLGLKFVPVYDIEYMLVNGKKAGFKKGSDNLLSVDVPSDSLLQCNISYSGRLPFRS